MDNCYKGPAYVALSAKWVDIYMNVRTADNAIDASVNGLRQTISMMENKESGISSGYANLETGKNAPTYL